MVDNVIWGLHMGRHHGLKPVEQGYVAIGWHEMGDLSAIPPNREAFKARIAATFPTKKPGAIPGDAGVLYRFSVEMKAGDIIIHPSKIDRQVYIGLGQSATNIRIGAR